MSHNFETTQWSLVLQAGVDTATARREALEVLLATYMPVLQRHLVRFYGLPADRADDLVQGFVLKNVIEGDLLQRADANAGKFRSWILKWLKNYVRSELRGQNREQDLGDEGQESARQDVDAFEADWARTTLVDTLHLMKRECLEKGQRDRWVVFWHRLLQPLLSGTEPTAYEDLIQNFGIESKAQAQNHLVSAKRHFQRALENSVGRYQESPEDVSVEIGELYQILCQSTLAEISLDAQAAESVLLDDVDALLAASPNRLAKLLDLDMASVWQRCLDARISNLIGASDPPQDDCTVRDCLLTEATDRSQLIGLKEFGSQLIAKENKRWPIDVGLALYLLAIAAAKSRYGEWITSSDPKSLQPGIRHLLKEDWLAAELRELLNALIPG